MVMQVSGGGHSQGEVGTSKASFGGKMPPVVEHAAKCTLMDEVATIAVWTGAVVLICTGCSD